MKRVIIILVFLIVVGILSAQSYHGARAQGMGGAFTALSDDPSALNWNPAGLSLFRHNAFVTNYTSMHAGFSSDNLGTGSLGYVHHLPDFLSLGLSGDILYSDIYSRNVIGLSFSRKFGKWVSAGLRSNLFISSYNESNFIPDDGQVGSDPFFDRHGLGKNSFGVDAGVIAKPYRGFSLGLYGINLLQPDMALSSIESKLHSSVRFATAYTFLDKYTLSAEGIYNIDAVNDEAVKFAIGAETWQMDGSIGLRTGYNPDFFSVGASYRNPSLSFLGFDYSFLYPISKVSTGGGTSHKFSLSLGYYNEKLPKKAEPEVTMAAPEPKPEPIVPPEPTATVIITPSVLEISNITQIYEEEPLVPVVFFDEGSSTVDSRFNPLIEVIGERLANNPDVALYLYGYFDARSEANDDNLGIKRAEAIRARFAQLVPGSERNIIVVKDGYAFDDIRAGLGRDAPTETQQRWINQENRRVAFRIDKRDEQTLNTSMQASRAGNTLKSILDKNPDLDVIISGGESLQDMREVLAYKDNLLEYIPREHKERLYVSLGGTKGQIDIRAEGILYRPREIRSALEIADEVTEAIVNIEAHVDGGFNQFAIDIVDEHDNVFQNIASGSGFPPSELKWDWHDEQGNFIDTRAPHFASMYGIDTLGREVTVISRDTFRVHVTGKEVIQSRLLVVQFVYDEDIAQVPYLENRLEYIARKLIEYAKEDKTLLKVEIAGHTDVLGTERRNIELSKQRAELEYKNIRQYLMALLGFNQDTELDKWFSDNNVDFSFAGYGQAKPYTISRWTAGTREDVMLGDNQLPEGRTINRRVVIDMELVKER